MTEHLRVYLKYAAYLASCVSGREEHGLPAFGGTAMWSLCLSWAFISVGYFMSIGLA